MPAVVAEIDAVLDVVIGFALLAVLDQPRLPAGFDLSFIKEALAIGAENRLADVAVGLLVLAVNDDELAFARAGCSSNGLSIGAEHGQAKFAVAGAFLA